MTNMSAYDRYLWPLPGSAAALDDAPRPPAPVVRPRNVTCCQCGRDLRHGGTHADDCRAYWTPERIADDNAAMAFDPWHDDRHELRQVAGMDAGQRREYLEGKGY